VVLIDMMMLAMLGSAEVEKKEVLDAEDIVVFDGSDVPDWEEGTCWTYRIDNTDFTFSEVERRYIDVHFQNG
jgi:hypothetical protein